MCNVIILLNSYNEWLASKGSLKEIKTQNKTDHTITMKQMELLHLLQVSKTKKIAGVLFGVHWHPKGVLHTTLRRSLLH
jgi:hypothetical protein